MAKEEKKDPGKVDWLDDPTAEDCAVMQRTFLESMGLRDPELDRIAAEAGVQIRSVDQSKGKE